MLLLVLQKKKQIKIIVSFTFSFTNGGKIAKKNGGQPLTVVKSPYFPYISLVLQTDNVLSGRFSALCLLFVHLYLLSTCNRIQGTYILVERLGSKPTFAKTGNWKAIQPMKE